MATGVLTAGGRLPQGTALPWQVEKAKQGGIQGNRITATGDTAQLEEITVYRA